MKTRLLSRKLAPMFPLQLASLCFLLVISLSDDQVSAFHLSFGHRLFKQTIQNNPQLNPASTLIRPNECRNANNHSEVGICMFSIDCMQSKGVPLSVCKHNYFVGTCCRLPDYNNFVGIVYDLRDTETANQLEARKSTAAASASLLSTSAATSVPSGTNETQPIATTTRPQEPTGAPRQQQAEVPSERIDEKYVIASSSLFSAPTTTTTTTNRPQQQANEQQSARNADGSASQQQNALATEHWPAQQPASNLVDTFQIQMAAPATNLTAVISSIDSNSTGPDQSKSSSEQQQAAIEFAPDANKQTPINSSAYELIRADLQQANGASEPTGEVLSSAHSAPASISTTTTANTSSSQRLDLQDQTRGPSSAGDDLKQQQQTTAATVVFSNQHQPTTAAISSGVELISIAQKITSQFAAAPSSSGDQEFALSSASTSNNVVQQQQSSSAAHSESIPSTGAPSTASSSSPTSHSSPAEQVVSSATVSPFVDLISSPSSPSSSPAQSQQQTTTPDFTSSLSTASLPVVSAHPYAPTTTTPSPAPPVQTTTVQQQALVSNPTPSTATAATTAATKTSTDQQQSNQSQAPPIATIENNQHPNSFLLSSLLNSANHNNSQRPTLLLSNSNLQATSKIVAAPTTNHLIPGLSGLQSAILSHIPFKIASGLSSGLSSYLQAAMNKPTAGQLGSHNSKPLLSSNTATALQYQQQQHQNSSNPKPSGSVAIKFPSSTTTTTTTTTTNPTAHESLGQISLASSLHSTQTRPNFTVTSELVPRDIVREAQLVCGRPQVSSSSSPLSPPESNSIQSTPNSKRRVGRIVGGNQSWFGQWPWMVSLRQWRKGAFLHKCGAALLNEHWAITAAHCVENVKASDLLLRLGEFDVSKHDEPFPFVERRVKSIVAHPSFDPKTFEYDLALLRFTEPISYERNIIPVCVPQGNDSYVDRMATVIGWGRLYEDGPLPDVIQHVDVPIITNNECERMYKNAGYIEEIPEMFICAGINKGGRDSCEGDSGGPLTMVDHDGRSYLVGIISWGIEDLDEEPLLALRPVKPNSSRVIIDWPLLDNRVAGNESGPDSAGVVANGEQQVLASQHFANESSADQSQLVNSTANYPTANSDLPSSATELTTTERQSSSTTARPWRRPTPHARRTTTRSRPMTSSSSSATTESPPDDDPKLQLIESVHSTPRPYDPKLDCGVRPMQTGDNYLASNRIELSRRAGRVVGGRNSQLGEFPWSVLIRETSLLGFFVKTKCGGVLIDLKWVLTAAHCQPGMFGSLIVVVGEFDLSSASGSGSSRTMSSGQHPPSKTKPLVRKVKRMIVHRDYNPSNFDNDIALLELESPFQVQPNVVPICLPERDDDDQQFIGRQAIVAGWGKLSFGGPVPSVLQVAKLPVISNKQCQKMYHDSGHIKLISDSFLCAGYATGGQDSCEGDSGGPLQVQRLSDSRWTLIGTVSHGIKCAEPNLPGIYIRTAAYLPWIRAVTYHQDHNKRYGH